MNVVKRSIFAIDGPTENDYPKTFFDGLFTIYKMGGLYHPEKQASRTTKLFYRIYSITMIIILYFLYTPAELMMVSYTRQDLSLLVEHVGMIATHVMGIVKYSFLYYNYSKLLYIVNTLNRDEFKYESYEWYQPGKYMSQCRKWSNFICILFFWISTLVPTSKQYDSVLKFIQEGDLVDRGNVTCQEMLPYFSWFPFSVHTTFRCEIAFVIQSIPMIWYCYPIICGDCSFGCLCVAFRGHFINLQGACRTIKQRCMARLNLPKDYDPLHMEENPRLQREIRMEIKRITVHLQTMIEVCDIFENIFSFVTLCQTLTSMFLIVTCLYIISNEEFMSPVFVAESEFVGAGMIELLVYCGFGNEMTDSSSELANAIFESEWFSFPESEKRTLLISMMRLQRPIQFTTGKFAVLNLSTFVSIVKGSYSYFTFLRQSK